MILLLYSSSECCCLFSTTLINLALNLTLFFVLSAFTAVHGGNPAPPAVFVDPRKSEINYQPQLESRNLPPTSISSMFFFFDPDLQVPVPVLCSVLVCSIGYSDKIHVSQGMHNRHSPNQDCCRMRKLAETANVVISSTKNTSSRIITDQQEIPDEYGT